MYACSFISRVNYIWKFPNVVYYVVPKPIIYSQGCNQSRTLSCARKVCGPDKKLGAMEHNKKQRTVKSVWRPVSTQSNSDGGYSKMDAKTKQVTESCEKSYHGDQVKVEHLKTSTCDVDIPRSTMDTEPISEQAESLSLNSVAMQCNDKPEALEENPIISVDVVENLSQSQYKEDDLKCTQTIICEEKLQQHGSHDLDVAVCIVNEAEKHSTSIEGCNQSRTLSCAGKVGGSENKLDAMEHNKKQRTVKSVWRPVSTQSNSDGGCSKMDRKQYQVTESHAKSYRGDQVKAERLKTSTCDVAILRSTMDTEPVSEQAESVSLNSVAMQCNDKPEALEEKSIISVNVVENLSKSQYKEDELKSTQSIIYEEKLQQHGSHELDVAVCEVNETKKHSTSIEVGASLIRFIKGKGGSKQKQIEDETGVKIIIPSSKGNATIVIEGTSSGTVNEALEKINVVLEEAIKSPQLDYSHFISLPLAIHPELVEKLNDFQNAIFGNTEAIQDGDVNSDSNEDSFDDEDNGRQLDAGLTIAVDLKVQDDGHVKVEMDKRVGNNLVEVARSSILSDNPAKLGIDKSIFIKPKTFHLTVLMLKLWNKERVAAATEVLQSVSSKVKEALDSRPVFVRIKGLELMKGSQAKARVLYAPVEEIGGEDRLLRACQVITEAYIDAGLVLERDAQQKLKLHATLMNARHRKRKKRTKKFDSFDARDIYKQYGSAEWGEYLIREAHLSQRFAFDDNGYYHCCTSIPFPEEMQIQ